MDSMVSRATATRSAPSTGAGREAARGWAEGARPVPGRADPRRMDSPVAGGHVRTERALRAALVTPPPPGRRWRAGAPWEASGPGFIAAVILASVRVLVVLWGRRWAGWENDARGRRRGTCAGGGAHSRDRRQRGGQAGVRPVRAAPGRSPGAARQPGLKGGGGPVPQLITISTTPGDPRACSVTRGSTRERERERGPQGTAPRVPGAGSDERGDDGGRG